MAKPLQSKTTEAFGAPAHTIPVCITPVKPKVLSFALQEVPWFGFSLVMGHILRKYRKHLLRVKGLMLAADDSRPLVVQCVQDIAYPLVRLPAWPTEGEFADGYSRLVFITRGLQKDQIESLCDDLSNLPGDRSALRKSSADLTIPTRCWFSQRVPLMDNRKLQHSGWFIQSAQLK